MRFFYVAIVYLILTSCASNPTVPVLERIPPAKKTSTVPTKPKANIPSGKDWRPDSHTVKKGDTLFSIGLEYGFDYKEIAAANNIEPPYPIKIGQKLNLTSLKGKSNSLETKSSDSKPLEEKPNEDGVVITPIKTDTSGVITNTSVANDTSTKPLPSNVTPILTEPKATREPFSIEALNRVSIKATEVKNNDNKPSDTKSTEAKSADLKSIESKPVDEENISWIWPTNGKISANFDGASNKGVDIPGNNGQPVVSAAAGKVIYTGSDLRGYGKLVIIKHNKTFLSVYAHNSKITVKEGQPVVAGQKIAEMGNTDTNTIKLHFEIRRQGKSVDPVNYLPQNN